MQYTLNVEAESPYGPGETLERLSRLIRSDTGEITVGRLRLTPVRKEEEEQ
jgi:hypothetical protein